MMKKVICGILCLVLVFLMTACGIEIPQEETQTIVFTSKFLMVADVYPEEWIEDLNNISADQYLQLYINDDGETVTMVITPEQREFWLSIVEKGLHKLQTEIANINRTHKIIYSEDYVCMDVYYDAAFSIGNASYFLVMTEVFCAFGQLLNGVAPDSWYVSISVYNADTGKLVANGDSNTGFSYEPSDWEASK